MERKELVEMLTLVGRALATGDMVPVFQCYTFHGDSVSAYNDTLGIVGPKFKVETPFAVNGKVLLGLLSNCHSDLVDLKLEEFDLLVKSGRSTFKIPYLNEEAFLFEEPDQKWDKNVTITSNLLNGLEACLMTVSRSDTERKLMGVALKPVKSGIGFYSCDGDGLTRYTLVQGAVVTNQYLIPSEFCEALIKISADTESKEGKLFISKDWIKAELDTGYKIYGRLIADDNPLDHEALIKKAAKAIYVPIPEGLNDALSRARVVADPESAKTTLTIEGGRLKLLTEAATGIVRDSLAFPNHPEITANVSAELIQKPIALCDEVAVLDNIVAYRKGNELLQIVSNRND